MSETILLSLLNVLASMIGSYFAVSVKIEWLRADLKRAEHQLNDHTTRLRALELE
jgi:uncharacterized membrane protein YciS (DUF1049 family)